MRQSPFLSSCAVFIFCFLLGSTPIIFEKPTLILGTGEQRLLKIPLLKHYTLGAPLVRALKLPNLSHWNHPYLLLRGEKPGYTDLWVFQKNGIRLHYPIRIIAWVRPAFSQQLEKALEKLQELEIIPIGNKVLLRGTLDSIRELTIYSIIKNSFSNQIFDQVHLNPSLLQKGKTRLQSWIQAQKLSSFLHLKMQKNTIWIQGSLPNPKKYIWIKEKIRQQFPLVQFDIETLPSPSKVLYLKVFLLEFQTHAFHHLGIEWTQPASSFLQVTPLHFQSYLKWNNFLKLMVQKGQAHVLAQPELVVRNQGKAQLFAGGEIPIRTKTIYHSKVQWKPYGLTLHIHVLAMTEIHTRLNLQVEVSYLDSSGNTEIPGFRINRMHTQIDAVFSKPLLLSGLFQEQIRKQIRGIPFLQDLPLLGALFRSESFLKQKSELVIALIPYLSLPTSPMKRFQPFLFFPKGPLPPPRDWISPQTIETLKKDPKWPWNVL